MTSGSGDRDRKRNEVGSVAAEGLAQGPLGLGPGTGWKAVM